MLSGTCENDIGFYQVCGLVEAEKVKLGGRVTLCGAFSCTRPMPGGEKLIMVEQILEGTIDQKCRMLASSGCENFEVNEAVCAKGAGADTDDDLENNELVPMLSNNSFIQKNLLCDDWCDVFDCEDEANCNGFRYGMYCKHKFHPLKFYSYLLTLDICDGFQVCENGEDESNCTIPDDDLSNTCISKISGSRVLLRNTTRCFLVDYERTGYNFTYCTNMMDQTNCTDLSRVGVTCRINNFTSTVSKYMICAHQPQLCDDGMENMCVEISLVCTTHKHRLCDGIKDCKDNSDESNPLCSDMTDRTCVRTASNDNIARQIPIIWLHDRIVDCMDGKDEEPIWPTCGDGDTERYVVESLQDACENVFLCPDKKYVEYMDLCDGYESCGTENSICKVSRGSPDIYTKELKTVSRFGTVISSSFCLSGIENVRFLGNIHCQNMRFRFPDEEIFGVPTKNTLQLPFLQQNCDDLFGESYVMTSCTGNCISSKCPLKTAPKYDSCPSQFKNRVGSLVGKKYLTFLTKVQGVYHNNYFVCTQTKECLDYSKVCDLVEDCRDGSDEAECTNHFQCGNTNHYIPKTSVCDGTIDCLDTSDECNEKCSKRILDNGFLRAGSWFMAVFAVIGNAVVIMSELRMIGKCDKMYKLSNACFIILIAIGDLITGIYLLWLAVVDTFVYSENYCRVQWTWLTSLDCSILGVLSTTGNLLSLLSMATLSCLRAFNINLGFKARKEVTKKGKCKAFLLVLLVSLVSITTAICPLIPTFEDYFVNGMHYDPRMKLFIRFSNKEDHFNILQKYYGRMRKKNLSWKLINSMVYGMFSHDFQYEDLLTLKKKQEFYGNDAVCLFKYFVRPDDPQKIYTWTLLGLNLLCFVAIAIFYGFIDFLTIKSANRLNNDSTINRKIALIIATDFICWFPFIILCFLHSLHVMDGTKWYSLFSIVILPINSVINPILYSDGVSKILRACAKIMRGLCKCQQNTEDQPENAPKTTAQQPAVETNMVKDEPENSFSHDPCRIKRHCVSRKKRARIDTDISVDLVTIPLSNMGNTTNVVDIVDEETIISNR